MENSVIFRKNKKMVTREIDDETVLIPIYKTSDEINAIYTLNRTASRVWELIDGKKTLSAIKKQLKQEFDASVGEINNEMKKLLDDLKEIKAIV